MTALFGTDDAEPNDRRLVDPFGRTIRYLRVSVTDRCDFRCHYCMSEDMTFPAKRDVLSLRELDGCVLPLRPGSAQRFAPDRRRAAGAWGRDGLDHASLARHLQSGALDELTDHQRIAALAHRARRLVDLGIRRINVSLDTRSARASSTRSPAGGEDQAGPRQFGAALAAGLDVKGQHGGGQGFPASARSTISLRYAMHCGMAMTLIETMPLGRKSAASAPIEVSATAV